MENKLSSWARYGALLASKNPWGNGPSDGEDSNGPKNPWVQPPKNSGGGSHDNNNGSRGPAKLEELFGKGMGGGGFNGGFTRNGPNRKWWIILLFFFLIIWLATTSWHRIAPQEKGVVTRLGSYSRTLSSGPHFTFPAPFERVRKVDVEAIRTIDIPNNEDEKLILTGDQNIIDLAYSVRWNIGLPEQYIFQISEPEVTIEEVAESAMRAIVANFSLDDAIGAERTLIEQQVQVLMQDLLDGYGAGVIIQGVAIKKADPPKKVNDAFKEVSAAQQEAQTYLNEARAYSQQLTAQAQGEAAAFDKVYAEYKLAPGVTRQRMYYETMEQVLSGVDKTIIEADGVTPYLPLPEIRKRSLAPPIVAIESEGN